MKIGLGTVQFGIDYGISNADGQTPIGETAAIVRMAHEKGIRIIDTAPAYGCSEEILGQVLAKGHEFRIVTKVIPLGKPEITEQDAGAVDAAFLGSLDRLGQPSVYGLMIHKAGDLLAPGGELIFERMERLKGAGLVEKIGVSVYSGAEIDRILDCHGIDLIQVPVNVLDQRLLHSGKLAKLKRYGVEVHARSAFLQGLLLMQPETLPEHFDPIRELLQQFHAAAGNACLSPLQAALNFLGAIPEIDHVICGVNNANHLEEICDASGSCVKFDAEPFSLTDEQILNPVLWPVVAGGA